MKRIAKAAIVDQLSLQNGAEPSWPSSVNCGTRGKLIDLIAVVR
jgi:hypothetical protein